MHLLGLILEAQQLPEDIARPPPQSVGDRVWHTQTTATPPRDSLDQLPLRLQPFEHVWAGLLPYAAAAAAAAVGAVTVDARAWQGTEP